MNIKSKMVALACLLTLLVVNSTLAVEIEYLSEEFPPYNFKDKTGQIVGINVDTLEEMFKVMKINKTHKDVKILPWVRGMKEIRKAGGANVLFSTTRTKDRESEFKWVGPLTTSTNGILVLKGNPNNVTLENDADYQKFKFAAVKEDLGDLYLQSKGLDKSKISYSTNIISLIKRIQSKRLDALSYNVDVGLWLIKQAGLNPDDFETVTQTEIGKHYFAFNKSVDDKTVEEHQKALDKVKSNTELMNKIRSKYTN